MEDLTPLYNKEFYLAYLCGEDVVLPIPDGNTEHYLAYLCGMDVEIPDVPDGNNAHYLAYKCGQDVELPDPLYRIEFYLAKWCGIDCEVPEPMYRLEYWLAQLANSGELKTVTGNPISVSDALAKPAESLTIEILPQQDLHGYDNPWPAGGGKNRFDKDTLSQVSAYRTLANSYYYTDPIVLKPNTAYVMSPTSEESLGVTDYYVLFINPDASDPDYIVITNTQVRYPVNGGVPKVVTFTTGETGTIRLGVVAQGVEPKQSAINAFMTINYQIEEGLTPTTWTPYSNICPISGWSNVNVYREAQYDAGATPYATINLNGTVYGGTLDVTSGVLTKAPYYDSYNGEPLVGPWVSSMDKYVSGTTPTTGAQVVDLGGTGTDVQLTATEVQMLLGNNTIWNDVGDMVLEYLADGPADDIDALNILLNNRYVNNGAEDEATDREALDILLGGR